MIALFDADRGVLLALMDSTVITSRRTAAATAVAAKFLARADAGTAAIVGCAEQGRSQLRALALVRTPRRATAVDIDGDLARRFAAETSAELRIPITAGTFARAAARQSDIVVTCTPSKHAILGPNDIAPGAFVAAVGADSENKQELEPKLLAQCTVVADILDQCAAFGDLHHAIDAGAMKREDVYAELADVVSGKKPGRRRDDERNLRLNGHGDRGCRGGGSRLQQSHTATGVGAACRHNGGRRWTSGRVGAESGS